MEKYFKETNKRRNQGKAQIFFTQETNLDPSREEEIKDLAKYYKFHFALAFAKANNDGTHYGGTLTLVDEKTAEIKNDYTLDENGGALVTELDWSGAKITVVNIYAPAKPVQRIDFFNEIKNKIKPDMIMMGDWNCVPDVLLDVQSPDPSKYKNFGGALLESIMHRNGLRDFRREQLSSDKEPTRIGTSNQKNSTNNSPASKSKVNQRWPQE